MPMIPSAGRKALAVLAVLGGAALAAPASASCYITQQGFVAQDVEMDMGQVVILPNLPVGGLIKELVVPINQRNSLGYCDRSGGNASGRFVNAAQQNAVPGFSNVYATDVAGVGIRVYRDSGTIQSYYPHTLQLPGDRTLSLTGGRFRVELIKTAAQTGSGVIAPNGRFTTYYLDGDGPGRPELTSTFKGSGTTVVSPTCSVQAGSRNIAVDFGSVPNTAFTGVGSRAVDRDFDIHLDCQGSNVAEYQSRIGIRLDADQDSSNMPGVLALSAAADSATRIGIQMVQRDGTGEREVRFGQTLEIGTTAPGSRTLSLPLRARYVQTRAGSVGAGVANGQATFTIQYN
ncbi:fimbrial protein [Stenotrophomonas mori]|uniref:Type 1 fimbrial protein n=1 Tax=Stenotrophomonas mori TaxID=2871096 RepID=A0ABT0SJT7_9GAMM|nr:fimbrial protein [Stenotrophomonas mori]MCL7715583.1 type 1 fimbrial protein [Stenotrophomonas mori]